MSPAEAASHTGHRTANTLKIYALYRASFALLFLTLLLIPQSLEPFAPHLPLYTAGTAMFLITTALFLAHAIWRGFTLSPRVLCIHQVLDLGAIGVISFACGGANSGLALPMVITIASAAAILEARLTLLLLASIGSLTLLIQESALELHAREANLFAAGLLGALLFGIALGIRQLSERLRTSEHLRALQETETARLEKLNELIIQRMRTGLVVVDQHGVIALINRAAADLLGGQRTQQPLAAGGPLSALAPLHQRYRRWQHYPWLQAPTFTVGANDIQPSFAPLDQTDSRLTLIFLEDNRAQMQRAQELKLASLGKLTAGIAHEIRNPLGAANHAAQLLTEQLATEQLTTEQDPVGRQIGRLAEIIVTHTERINDIVENVLQLSRQRPAEGSRFDLRAWLGDFLADFAQQPGGLGALETEGGSDALTIEFDPSHLRQILTNLLDNALRHSAAQDGQRWALLRTGIDEVSERPWLEVMDRGSGVDPSDQDRLFEPFFTKSQQGTGLGLYISRELCEMNRATLEYRAPPSGARGACFRIGFAHPHRGRASPGH